MELPWVDDVLGEALALLTDWDDHPTATADVPCAPTESANAAASRVEKKRGRDAPGVAVNSADGHDAPPRRAVKINLSRERQKQEILSLQESVVELQEELARIQLRGQKKPRVEPGHAQAGESTATASNGSVVAWETAARRQFRSRRRAEAMNAKLRHMLSTQMAVAEDLIRVIQRAERARQEAQQMALFPVSSPDFPMVDPVNDQHLRRRLLKISTQWHVPFAKCDQFHDRVDQPRELLFYDIKTTREGREALVLDIRASTPSTFPLEDVESILWSYFLTLRCTEDDFSLATESEESADTLVGCLRATASHDGIHGVLNSRFMKQRFRNVEGELVIASSYCGRPDLQSTSTTARSAATSDDHLTKIDAILFEDSWLRVFRVADPVEATASPSGITLIQHVRRSRIQFCGANKPDTRQIDAVEKFFTRLAENELRWSQEVMERSMILGTRNSHLP